MPGATVHAVAQRHGVNTSQLFTWRKRYRGDLGLPAPAAAAFAAVELVAARSATETSEAEVHPHAQGVIEIDLPRHGRLRISGCIDPAVVTAALRALVRR
jgi:transposase-like protein